MSKRSLEDSGGSDAGSEPGAGLRHLRPRPSDSAGSEAGSESGETERRRSRRRLERTDQITSAEDFTQIRTAAETTVSPAKVTARKSVPAGSSTASVAVPSLRTNKKIYRFKKPANITAKNKATALLTKTGKKKRKPFKGLSYSFVNKKKKKTSKSTEVPNEDVLLVEKEIDYQEGVEEEFPEEAGEDEELDEAITEEESPEMEEVVEDIREKLLKGKARKSIPQVVLKKSFVPSIVRDGSPDSFDDPDDEMDVGGPDDDEGGAAKQSLRRVGVPQLYGGPSCPSPAGSVTGASSTEEAAPPEGGVLPPSQQPHHLAEPILPEIGCKCTEKRTPVADIEIAKREFFCQGIDAIDGRLVGCCNPVNCRRMIRPSAKVPFLMMCGLHRERLRRHHCCPSCGVFCTQGIFMRCINTNIPHLYHRKCAFRSGESFVCPHCGQTEGMKTVQLTIRTGRTPTFYHEQMTVRKRSGARMSISREVDSVEWPISFSRVPAHLNPYRLVLPDGRMVTANGLPLGPDREQLERSLAAINSARAPAEGAADAKIGTKEQLRALRTGELEKLLQLLAEGWPPDQKFREISMQTGMHVAAQHGQVAVAHVLVSAGATLDPVDRELQTPLMLAAARAQNAMVKYLVAAGAALDARGEDGMTPLHLASQAGNIEGCHYLLSSGRAHQNYVNMQDDGGWTPVVWASEHKHPTVVKYLLERGASPRICDEEQNTGLHWAAFSGSMEIAELFLTAGCCVNSPNVHGDTPLHIAARQRHQPCVLLMMAHGANLHLRNREGMLALDCSGEERSDTRVALLLNMELSRLVARAGTRRAERVLSNDISRGKEKLPIQAVNEVDDTPLPTDYVYIAESCETMKLNIDRTITSLQSCNCLDNCLSSGCMCSEISLRCWYDPEGRLLPEFNYADPPMIFECNRACGCNQLTCNNRAVQHGITARIQLYRTPDRGWGVRALKHIAKGSYICEYVGELITDSAADQREDDSYLFDLDNRDGDTFCIDARRYGNVARFINHRCEPNLVPVKVFVDHQDVRFPRIALFTCRDVQPAEELGFDYGEKFWMIKYKMFTCKCGLPKCKYSSEKLPETLANYNRKQAEAEEKAAAAK